MPNYTLDKKDFLKGHAISSEIGGFLVDSAGVDPYNADEIGGSSAVNSVGALRTGYSLTDFGSTGVTTLITQMLTAADSSDNTIYLFGFGGAKGYRVNMGTDAAPTELTTASGFDDGIALYNNGTDLRIYVAGATAIADVSTLFGTMVFTNPTGGSPPALTSGRPHPMFVKNTILFVGDDNDIYALDNSTTWRSGSQLDIEKDQVIHSISEWDRYLAIGSMSFYATPGNNATGVISSKVYFWDMYSDSWNFDTTLPGTLVQLKNDGGILYALTALTGGFGLYVFNGSRFEELVSKNDAGLSLITAAGNTVFDTDRGRFYWLMKDTEVETRFFNISDVQTVLDVYAYGSFYNKQLPAVIHKPYRALKAGSSFDIGVGALKVGRQNKVYVSFQSAASTFKLGVFKTGNETDAFIQTVELDSYFNGDARLKELKRIRFDFDPLATGDIAVIYTAIDHATSFTRVDGGSSDAAANRISNADTAGENSRTFLNFDRKSFRDLRLGIAFTGGDIRIRRIKIDFDYAPDPGN